MDIIADMTRLELILIGWLVFLIAIVNMWFRNNQKIHDLDDKTIADLEGQIERMMDTAIDNDAGERLWAARVPDGACARKLREADR